MIQPRFHITEDGEAVGTLREFSSRFRLTPASVMDCLRHRSQASVVLDAGEGRERLLIVDEGGVEALTTCGHPNASAP